MTTREAVAVRLSETKERSDWCPQKALGLVVAALPLLLVAAILDGALLYESGWMAMAAGDLMALAAIIGLWWWALAGRRPSSREEDEGGL